MSEMTRRQIEQHCLTLRDALGNLFPSIDDPSREYYWELLDELGKTATLALTARSEALLAKVGQGWVPVRERLPEEGVSVLCECRHTRQGAWFIAVGRIQGKFADLPCWNVPGHNGDFGGISGEVTHWMPLPPPPERP